MYIKREPVDKNKLAALRAEQPTAPEQPVFEDGKEFIIVLKKDVDYDSFWNDMENESSVNNIPNRPVRIFNNRTVMKRICHYVLTDEEAGQLANDDRVLAVEIPIQFNNKLTKSVHAVQANNFSKPVDMLTGSGDLVNYGLPRCNSTTNNYLGYVTSSKYNHTLTGKGVDIIIHDTGIQADHPEFTDENGDSRVQHIDWYEASGRFTPAVIPINLLNSSLLCASTNSTIQFYTNPTQSAPYYGESVMKNTLALGSVIGCLYGVQHGKKENGRIIHYSYYGGDTSDWQSLGGVIWEAKFCDQGHIEIFIWRHDAATTAGAWGMYNQKGEKVVDLNGFRVSSLEGSSSQAVNFVLVSSNQGQDWEVFGGVDRPYHLELVNDQWTPVPGTGDYSGGFSAGLSPIFQQTVTNKLVSIGNIFDFNFYLFNTYTTPQAIDFYSDTVGHGTHVGGIIAGKTYGWAKNAHIYAMKVEGLEGYEGGGIPDPDCFDLIIEWHNRKPVDPETGVKRPTIINMSWGYGIDLWWYYPASGIYRGQIWQEVDTDLTTVGFPEMADRQPARVVSVDTSIDEMIDAGIHICIAAGNDSFKIDLPNGIDYNNYWSMDDVYNPANSYANTPLHRGSSPYSLRAMITGCMDAYILHTNKETKVYFSNCGPGVDLYAPGHSIMSATSQDTQLGNYDVQRYFLDTEFNQCNLSGTSMSSPQSCGMGAIFLEANPGATPEELKNFIVNNAPDVMYSTGLDDDFADDQSLCGGSGKVLYNKFNSPNPLKIDRKP